MEAAPAQHATAVTVGPVGADTSVEALFPHARPARWVRAANWCLGRAEAAGAVRFGLDAAERMADAEARTGLGDWGEGFARDALEVMLASARDDARLNALGRLTLVGSIRRALCAWLLLVDEQKRHPEALSRPVERPVIVAALPRTGSTFLHHLLAAHPDARFLPMWLASRPLPAPAPEEWRAGGSAARRRSTALSVGVIRTVFPAMQEIHAYGVDLPVECTHLMLPTFHSNQWAAWPLHGYVAWASEHAAPYAPYRAQLQLLQARLPGRGWVLKSPGHFLEIAGLYDAVPEALIVHLHRDPARVIPSLNSMMACHHLAFTDAPDFARSAAAYLQVFADAADRMVAHRARVGSDRFVDVGYRELKADPLGVAERIFARAGMRWDDEVRGALGRQLATGRGEGTRHRYPAAQFGQDAMSLRERFAPYLARFGVEPEAAP